MCVHIHTRVWDRARSLSPSLVWREREETKDLTNGSARHHREQQLRPGYGVPRGDASQGNRLCMHDFFPPFFLSLCIVLWGVVGVGD